MFFIVEFYWYCIFLCQFWVSFETYSIVQNVYLVTSFLVCELTKARDSIDWNWIAGLEKLVPRFAISNVYDPLITNINIIR